MTTKSPLQWGIWQIALIATPKKGWQFWRPHPRDFWYIGFEINEADVSIFVLICQQGCGWCDDHSFRASEGAMIIHNWRACVVCCEGWQNRMILTFEKCKLSARLTWATLFAFRAIWKRVHGILIRFDLQKVPRLAYTDDLGWSDGRIWHSQWINSEALRVAEGIT